MAFTRRTALALSGAVAGTVAAASLAGALVIGGADDQDPTPPEPIAVVDSAREVPGTAPAPATAPDVEVVYQDVYDLPPATAPAGRAGAVGSSPAPTAPAVTADLSSTAAGDDDWDDDEYDDGYEDDGYEDESEHSDDDDDDDDDGDYDDDEGEWEDD